MTLDTILTQYEIARDIKAVTRIGYSIAVDSFSRFLGRRATAEDLQAEPINRWLAHLQQEKKLSPYTVKNRRTHLLVLARFAALDLEACPMLLARRIRSPKLPPTKRDVWTSAEVDRIIATVRSQPDYSLELSGIRRRAFWAALIGTAWDTAFRLADLKRLTRHHIPVDGDVSKPIEIVQSKTGVEHIAWISRQTWSAIDESFAGLPGDRELLFPVPGDRWVQKHFQRILHAAGLTGTFHKLRRSSIYNCERQKPGSGMLQAGHTNEHTTRTFYLPRRSMLEDRPRPKALMQEREPLTEDLSKQTTCLRVGQLFEIHAPGAVQLARLTRDDRGRLRLTTLTRAQEQPFRIVPIKAERKSS